MAAAYTVPTAAYAPTKSLAFTPGVTAYGASAPVSAPFGESAPSAEGRRLLVDYRGSDPVGFDILGNGANGVRSSGEDWIPMLSLSEFQGVLLPVVLWTGVMMLILNVIREGPGFWPGPV